LLARFLDPNILAPKRVSRHHNIMTFVSARRFEPLQLYPGTARPPDKFKYGYSGVRMTSMKKNCTSVSW